MPDYLTAIQAWHEAPVADFCARIAHQLERHSRDRRPPRAPAQDPDFPADWHYGVAPRRAETQFLIQAVDRLREMGVYAPESWQIVCRLAYQPGSLNTSENQRANSPPSPERFPSVLRRGAPSNAHATMAGI